MAKKVEGKRIKIEVEMYWRGKKKTPSVSITYAGPNFSGLAPWINDRKFSDGCDDLCKQLVEHGELDAEEF